MPIGKGEGLTITPYAAGHLIGGSIWRISSAVGEDVVYAVDYNHRKELHLNSTALSTLFSRPSLMIADADRSVLAMVHTTIPWRACMPAVTVAYGKSGVPCSS